MKKEDTDIKKFFTKLRKRKNGLTKGVKIMQSDMFIKLQNKDFSQVQGYFLASNNSSING